jgi:hypothetical protein
MPKLKVIVSPEIISGLNEIDKKKKYLYYEVLFDISKFIMTSQLTID